jgi:hypothetical protein
LGFSKGKAAIAARKRLPLADRVSVNSHEISVGVYLGQNFIWFMDVNYVHPGSSFKIALVPSVVEPKEFFDLLGSFHRPFGFFRLTTQHGHNGCTT